MKIGLLNLEPKYKNLAIEKLRVYHQMQGDEVEDYFALCSYDKVYASSIFTFTSKAIIPKGAICGGSGFDLTTTLPPKIEVVKPHLNFGFTTRGCPHKCPFCIVNLKEGDIRIVGTLRDLWDGVARLIICMDNNILAVLNHFFKICYESIDLGVTLDFNQGLDFRFVTTDVAKILKVISHKEYHFAFDHPSYLKGVDKAIDLLQTEGINRCNWYVLVGFNTTFQEDLDRLNYLKERNQNAFVQRYKRDRQYVPLARWANQHHIFHGMSWSEFLDLPENSFYRGAMK